MNLRISSHAALIASFSVGKDGIGHCALSIQGVPKPVPGRLQLHPNTQRSYRPRAVSIEKDLNPSHLVGTIDGLMFNDEKRNALKRASKALGKPHACEDIYKEIKNLLNRG